jgi:hypothetical protein
MVGGQRRYPVHTKQGKFDVFTCPFVSCILHVHGRTDAKDVMLIKIFPIRTQDIKTNNCT